MRVSIALRRSVLCGVSAASLLAAPAAFAGQAAPAADPDSGADIVVTGQRGLQRTVTNSAAPIDVISAADLARTGKPDALSALNALVPSFNSPARAGGGNASIIQTGALRGLNPDQTLVLVDGKRRHKSSLINVVSSLYAGSVPADLALIPVSAIDHIEVLRDGAAAKYGSDAIAGVINIILKRGEGGSASFTAGQNMDRSDGEFFQADMRVGQKLGENGFIDLFAQGRKQLASNRANPIAPCTAPRGATCLYPLVNGQLDPREATIDRMVTRNYGAFPQETLNLGYNASYRVGQVDIYSNGTYSQRRSDLNVTFRAPNNVNSLPQIYPNGFRPDQMVNEEDLQFVLGAKGNVSGWDWDLSTSYGKNRARLTESETLNASLGPTSPTYFYLGTLRSTEWVNSLDLTRSVPVGGGNLQISAGVQHRLESYGLSSGDPASYAAGSYVIPGTTTRPAPGAQGVSGITMADAGSAHRNNVAGYLNLTYDPSSDVTIDLAGRAEHYDDGSGNTVIGEASGRYRVAPWLTLRGAASTGFRAPSLAQQIYASTTGQFRLDSSNNVTLLQIKTLPVGSPAAIALGATPLKPETSTNLTAGLVLQPLPGFDITVDAYQIKVDKRIALTGTLTGSAISAIFVANGLPTDVSAQYYTNAIDTRTRGIDVVATYRVDLGSAGALRLNASLNYNTTDITNVIPNPPQLSALGANYVLFDRVARGNMTTLMPTTKILVGGNWTLGRFSLSPRVTRYGSYTIPQVNAALDRWFAPKWITDVEASVQLSDALTLSAGANNLFNVYPDANGVYNVALGSQQYGSSPPSPFGFTGGSYYARLSVQF